MEPQATAKPNAPVAAPIATETSGAHQGTHGENVRGETLESVLKAIAAGPAGSLVATALISETTAHDAPVMCGMRLQAFQDEETQLVLESWRMNASGDQRKTVILRLLLRSEKSGQGGGCISQALVMERPLPLEGAPETTEWLCNLINGIAKQLQNRQMPDLATLETGLKAVLEAALPPAMQQRA